MFLWRTQVTEQEARRLLPPYSCMKHTGKHTTAMQLTSDRGWPSHAALLTVNLPIPRSCELPQGRSRLAFPADGILASLCLRELPAQTLPVCNSLTNKVSRSAIALSLALKAALSLMTQRAHKVISRRLGSRASAQSLPSTRAQLVAHTPHRTIKMWLAVHTLVLASCKTSKCDSTRHR